MFKLFLDAKQNYEKQNIFIRQVVFYINNINLRGIVEQVVVPFEFKFAFIALYHNVCS